MTIELHNIDCMHYMRTQPDKAFDLAVVDPPYGIGNFTRGAYRGKKYNKKWDVPWNDITPGREYFAELQRVSRNQIIWGINYYAAFVPAVGRIVWDKQNESGVGSACEIASQSFDLRVVKCIVRHTGFINTDIGAKIHPCQKPMQLYRWVLDNYAKPGQRILDTHLGSGSSAIAADYFGVDFVGCEIDEHYFKLAKERIDQETRQIAMF